MPCRTSSRGCWHEEVGKGRDSWERCRGYLSLREGQTGAPGATGVQDPDPEGFSGESRHMFQLVSLKVVGRPRGLSLGSPSCGHPSWGPKTLHRRAGGDGTEMPISEAKAGCDLPEGRCDEGACLEHRTREVRTRGVQGLGKEEAVMESLISTACGISVLDQGQGCAS